MSTENEQEFKYDVFISYSSQDKAWVRGELLPRIEQADLKAFVDYRDFTRGAPSLKECERGVLESRKTLLVLTPNYVRSGWTEIENIMAQTLDPANETLRMIPLLKADCKKPLRIATLTHIDFTDTADQDLAWRQLLTALGRPPEPQPPKQPQPDGWFLAHPYPMPPNFTGRLAERNMLTAWLNANTHPLLSLRALGGFGKSALTWHWLSNDVTPAAWPRVVWWSFYESDASFEKFLAETLQYLSGGRIQPEHLSAKEALVTLLGMLQHPGTLLILDGFERVLRAFGGLDAAYQGDEAKPEDNDRDCISPLAESFLLNVAVQPNLLAKVLLTTRLCPRILEARGGGLLRGCREEELTQLQPADAVTYFHAQGVRGTHTEVEQACQPYGYHPLSLCLLAGLIVRNLACPGDVRAAKGSDVAGDLVQRQHHVLEIAYDSLTPRRQTLLGRIACFRSPVNLDALQALAKSADQPAKSLNTDLHDLIARGLLHCDSDKATNESRFDLHPIVRRYAYDRLAAPDRSAAHTRLRDYFAAVPEPEKVTSLEDLAPVIELYHHTVRAGQLDKACRLFRDRINQATYYQLGAYQLRIDLLRSLFPDGEDRPPRLKSEGAQGWTLNSLANSYSLSGQPRRAVPLYEQVNAIQEKRGDKGNLATGLGNVADGQLKIGALQTAETNLRRRITLCQEIEDEFKEAIGHQGLGRLLAYRGAYAESDEHLEIAWRRWSSNNDYGGMGQICAYRCISALLTDQPAKAHAFAVQAQELALKGHYGTTMVERDVINAEWLLGAAHRAADHHDDAERHLHEALQRCRRINMVEFEAAILIDLARLRTATGDPDDAQRLAEEALLIADRSGYVLQAADAHLELAKLARDRDDAAAALDHARQARKLATCDGPPDYTYKAAYDEAGTLLEELEV